MGHHAVAVERDDLHADVGEIVGEEACARAESIVGVGEGEGDLLDADFQNVAGLGLFNINRSCKDVPAGAFVFDVVIDGSQRRFDLGARDSDGFEARGTVGDEGFDLDGVAGVTRRTGGALAE
jgi:hypothetical protein